MVNVSNPSSLFLEGSYDSPGTGEAVYVSGSYAYLADGDEGLQILDVSDPSSPSLTGSYSTHANDVIVAGDYAYLAGDSGLQILDISDPSSPYLVGSYSTVAGSIHIEGDYAYLAGGPGILVLNISNPSLPVLESSYDVPGYSNGIQLSGGYAYVAAGWSQLQIVKMNGFVTNINVAGPTTITATFPAGLDAGPYHVLVANPGGQPEEAYLSNGFLVSTGAVDYYCDGDGDSFINSNVDGTCTGTGCEPSGCTTTPGSDCDDGNASINPDTYWYQDYDEDGFGNSSISLQQCNDPSGAIVYVLDSNDYHDGDPNTGAPVYISGAAAPYYSSLQAAYDGASDGDTIKVIAVTFNEDLYIDRNISVTFECGYDGSFSAIEGMTTLIGNMTVNKGKLDIENVILE